MKCPQNEKAYLELADDLEGVIRFIVVNCDKFEDVRADNKLPICEIDQLLPLTAFYTPPKTRYNAEGKPNGPEESIYGGEAELG